MNIDPELIYLVGGVVFLLALSSMITRLLIRRNKGEASATLDSNCKGTHGSDAPKHTLH